VVVDRQEEIEAHRSMEIAIRSKAFFIIHLFQGYPNFTPYPCEVSYAVLRNAPVHLGFLHATRFDNFPIQPMGETLNLIKNHPKWVKRIKH
jgi:hypothetical protein